MIELIKGADQKRAIARNILEALRDWFEVDESREQYIADSADGCFSLQGRRANMLASCA